MTVQSPNHKLIDSIANLIETMKAETGTTTVKLNHATWERLATAKLKTTIPGVENFDALLKLEVGYAGSAEAAEGFSGYFTSGAMGEFLNGLKNIKADDKTFHCGISINAFTNDNRFFPVIRVQDSSQLAKSWAPPQNRLDLNPLLFKDMAENGTYDQLFEYLKDDWIIAVGPRLCSDFLDFARLPHGQFIPLEPNSIPIRDRIETEIAASIEQGRETGRRITVIHQASFLGTVFTFNLRPTFPEVRWLDFGLAMSLCNPHQDVFNRPWGRFASDRLAEGLNRWLGRQVYRPMPPDQGIERFFADKPDDAPLDHRIRPEYWRPNRTSYQQVIERDGAPDEARTLFEKTLRALFKIPKESTVLAFKNIATARRGAFALLAPPSVTSSIHITGADQPPVEWNGEVSILNQPTNGPTWLGPADMLNPEINAKIAQLIDGGQPLILEGNAQINHTWPSVFRLLPLGPLFEDETNLSVLVIGKTKHANLPINLAEAPIEDLVLALDWFHDWEYWSSRLGLQRNRMMALARKAGLTPIPTHFDNNSLIHEVPIALKHAPARWPTGDIAKLFRLIETEWGTRTLWIDARPRSSDHTAAEIFAVLSDLARKPT